MNDGQVSAKLGLKGIPAAAEEAVVARDIDLAEATGSRVHIAHASTAGSVDLIRRGKDKGIAVTAEVTPHHLTMTEERVIGYNTNAKMYPPLRTRTDVEALIAGLNDGVLDAIATDHAPHTDVDKLCDFNMAAFGISVLETALGSLLSLVHDGNVHLATLISKLTCEPSKILHNSEIGTLKAGACADVTIFDPQAEWTVDPATFASKGKNTPLAGQLLKGKVMATIHRGQVVYKDDSLKIETVHHQAGARTE
jgi:dihydroorotase